MSDAQWDCSQLPCVKGNISVHVCVSVHHKFQLLAWHVYDSVSVVSCSLVSMEIASNALLSSSRTIWNLWQKTKQNMTLSCKCSLSAHAWFQNVAFSHLYEKKTIFESLESIFVLRHFWAAQTLLSCIQAAKLQLKFCIFTQAHCVNEVRVSLQ